MSRTMTQDAIQHDRDSRLSVHVEDVARVVGESIGVKPPRVFGFVNLDQRREAMLLEYIDAMPANLLRSYVRELVEGSSPQDVDKWVVALRAQNAVPHKG